MGVSIGSITLQKDLVLKGLASDKPVMYNMTQMLGGNEHIEIDTASGTPTLTLEAITSPKIQGWFCYSHILAVEDLAREAQLVVLIHNDLSKNVLIVDYTWDEWYTWEPLGPNKRYSGSITLKEV